MNNEQLEITLDALDTLDSQSSMIIDIRDEFSFEYGSIPNAVNIPLDKLKLDFSVLPKDKLLVICCKSGQISDTLAEKLVRTDIMPLT